MTMITSLLLFSQLSQNPLLLKKENGKVVTQEHIVKKTDTVSTINIASHKLQIEKSNINKILFFSGIIILSLFFFIWESKKKNKKLLQTNISLVKQYQEMRRKKEILEKK